MNSLLCKLHSTIKKSLSTQENKNFRYIMLYIIYFYGSVLKKLEKSLPWGKQRICLKETTKSVKLWRKKTYPRMRALQQTPLQEWRFQSFQKSPNEQSRSPVTETFPAAGAHLCFSFPGSQNPIVEDFVRNLQRSAWKKKNRNLAFCIDLNHLMIEKTLFIY